MKIKIFLLVGVSLIFLLMMTRNPKFDPGSHDIVSITNLKTASFTKCIVPSYLLKAFDTTVQVAPLFDNLGEHTFKISTDNERAQAFFNQGLNLVYGFNHSEAHRSFLEAHRLDAKAAMAYWGEAYSLGPNINDPLPDDERKQIAFKASRKALELSANCTEKEIDLIKALLSRYSEDMAVDISQLNENFMLAMKSVAEKYPNDDDVLTLYAAAIMDTKPWDYWDKGLKPREYIDEAKIALEKAITLNPKNPGSHHYYIHLMELPAPDMAVGSAETLGKLMPAAGHLVHMPSHIFIRVGRYKDAVQANMDAINADEDYISQCYSQGLYPLAYYPHNIHFLWSASTLLGNSELAIQAATKTAEKIPVGQLAELHFLQDFAASPLLAYVRFGKWNEILTIPAPGEHIVHLSMIRNYARGIAFVRKNNIKEAKEELSALNTFKDNPDLASIIAVYNNNSQSIAKVAYQVLKGEIEAAEGNYEKAIEDLKQGIVYEEELQYSEPAPWHIPVRQTLGRILLLDNKIKEAEEIYRQDLNKNRQNGWSLIGLYHSLQKQGKKAEATTVKKEFDMAWKDADIKIENSTF